MSLLRTKDALTDEDFINGTTLMCIKELTSEDFEDLPLLPNMRYKMLFQTTIEELVPFYISLEEFNEIYKKDFYQITKTDALQAQRNTIQASISNSETNMSDFLCWVEATEKLATVLHEESQLISEYSGIQKNG